MGYPWYLHSPLTHRVCTGPGALTLTLGLGMGSRFFGYKGQHLCLELFTVDTQVLSLPDRSIGLGVLGGPRQGSRAERMKEGVVS